MFLIKSIFILKSNYFWNDYFKLLIQNIFILESLKIKNKSRLKIKFLIVMI